MKMEELDPRKNSILQAVVIEYVTGAEPVGSELLVQKYGLGVKSATVRNELAEMSELGYLEQPHTSAGRIPSDLGYRYYVDRLIIQRELAPTTKQGLREVTKEGDALQALLRDTVKFLSRVTQMLTVATTVRDSNLMVRSALLSALGPTQALVVLVLSNGHVENRIIECPPGITLQDIGKANELLAKLAAGSTLAALTKMKAPTNIGTPPADRLMNNLWIQLRGMARELTRGVLIAEGEEFMFAQPEFQRDVSSLTQLIDDLMESDVLFNALNAPPEQGSQTVTIGKEHRDFQMHQLSVVRRSFSVGEQEAGVIALIGPTRMKYDSSIPLVNYTAQALSESLTRFFG